MEKENQRIALSKRLLKKALLRLLARKELGKIRVTELCEEASINRATFYRHYQTPLDVLKDIERDCSDDLKKALSPPQTVEDFRRVTEQICVYLYDHAATVRLLLQCRTAEDIVREVSGSLWAAGSALEEYAGMDPATRQLVTAFLGFGSYHMLRQWMTEDIPKTPQEIAALVFSLSDLRGRPL
ncbi:MAG: TetR/AcrR family transcriptional regulator [Oscillospiraceae bacterium]